MLQQHHAWPQSTPDTVNLVEQFLFSDKIKGTEVQQYCKHSLLTTRNLRLQNVLTQKRISSASNLDFLNHPKKSIRYLVCIFGKLPKPAEDYCPSCYQC